jgi:hypothetical protein
MRDAEPLSLDTLLTAIDALAALPLDIHFESTIAGATFECRMDDGPFTPCEPPRTYDSLDALALGPHHFEVRAAMPDDVDGTPARADFTLVQQVDHPNLAVIAAEEGWTESPEGLAIDTDAWPRQVRPFYRLYPDDYVSVVLFTDGIPFSAGPFALVLKNDIRGIGLEYRFDAPIGTVDGSGDAGSGGTLETTAFMEGKSYEDQLKRALPDTHWAGTYLDILASEFAHRWLVLFRLPWEEHPDVLRAAGNHWSWTVGLDAASPLSAIAPTSILPLTDNGDGSFTATVATGPDAYASLDLYAMGLLPKTEVPDFYWVRNPRPAAPPSTLALETFTFSGERVDVRMADLVAALGERMPSYGDAPRSFRQAFVLVVPPGESPSPESLEWLDELRRDWEGHFSTATRGLGSVDTSLFETTRDDVSP